MWAGRRGPALGRRGRALHARQLAGDELRIRVPALDVRDAPAARRARRSGPSEAPIVDSPHNSIYEEEVDGERRHRPPPQFVPGLPGRDERPSRFAHTGQAVLLPGTNRTSSYLCVADDGVGTSLHSPATEQARQSGGSRISGRRTSTRSAARPFASATPTPRPNRSAPGRPRGRSHPAHPVDQSPGPSRRSRSPDRRTHMIMDMAASPSPSLRRNLEVLVAPGRDDRADGWSWPRPRRPSTRAGLAGRFGRPDCWGSPDRAGSSPIWPASRSIANSCPFRGVGLRSISSRTLKDASTTSVPHSSRFRPGPHGSARSGAPHCACPCRPPVAEAGCDGPRPCLGWEAAMIPEAVRVEQGDTSEPGDLWPSLDAFVERTGMRALVIGTSKDPTRSSHAPVPTWRRATCARR